MEYFRSGLDEVDQEEDSHTKGLAFQSLESVQI